MKPRVYKIPPFKDLSGKRFGHLTAIRKIGSDNGAVWECLCDCGKTIVRTARSFSSALKVGTGDWISCGCKKGNFYKHGICETRIYKIFFGMKSRCYRKSNQSYQNYGGRGIEIYVEWLSNPKSFYEWALKNGYNENLTIERIDNNKSYSPENCRWATKAEQNRNTRASHMITINGVTKCLNEWAMDIGCSHATIINRLKRGWTAERAVLTRAIVGRNQFSHD